MQISPLRRAATLIETAVLVAGISVLLSALAPVVVVRAQQTARSTTSTQNLNASNRALVSMTVDQGFFPLCYAYGADEKSGIYLADQQGDGGAADPRNGYVHWSFPAIALGYVDSEEAFSSPAVLNGGAPRTNPGDDLEDWEPGQLNELGQGAPAAPPEDRQARRLAFVPNGAIVPRNILNATSPRNNLFVPAETDATATARIGRGVRAVRPAFIGRPSRVVLLTEMHASDTNGWLSIGRGDASAFVAVSHRPIIPFEGISSSSVYNEPVRSETLRSFRYPAADFIYDTTTIDSRTDLLADSLTSLNTVGRIHPGGSGDYTGLADFAMVDGSVIRTHVRDTVIERLWGERFYSITGNNEVYRPAP